MNQMHQKTIDGKPVGVGYSGETDYVTAELKVCPSCELEILELYRAMHWPPTGELSVKELMDLLNFDIMNASTSVI